MDKEKKMAGILKELENLKESPLYEYRKSNNYHVVIGEGNLDADIMFVGEAPGENEAKQGRPFCGRAGKMLDFFLGKIFLKRENVYITNIVKDRPPGNRDPEPEEIAIYSLFLDRQIEVIRPKIIATLGRFSMRYLIDKYGNDKEPGTISQLHGKVLSGKMGNAEIKIMPMYHPAVAIYNRNMIDEMYKDFKTLWKITNERKK